MPILFSEVHVVMGLIFALLLMLAAGAGMMAAGSLSQTEPDGGTATAAYCLKVTLYPIFILAFLICGLFLLTTYR